MAVIFFRMERHRSFRIDGFLPDRVIESISRARIVRLCVYGFLRELYGFITVIDCVFKRVQFRSYKIDRVVTPRNDRLACHCQTQPYIVRQRFVTRDEHLHVLRCNCHELGGDDAAFGLRSPGSCVAREWR